MIKSTCKKSFIRDYLWKGEIKDNKNIYAHIITLTKILLYYMDGLLSKFFDVEDLINRTNHWFFHIQYFNKENIFSLTM